MSTDHSGHLELAHFDNENASSQDAQRYLEQLSEQCEECRYDYCSTPAPELRLVRVAALVELDRALLNQHPGESELKTFARGALWLWSEAESGATNVSAVQVAKHVSHCTACMRTLMSDDMFVKSQVDADERTAQAVASTLEMAKQLGWDAVEDPAVEAPQQVTPALEKVKTQVGPDVSALPAPVAVAPTRSPQREPPAVAESDKPLELGGAPVAAFWAGYYGAGVVEAFGAAAGAPDAFDSYAIRGGDFSDEDFSVHFERLKDGWVGVQTHGEAPHVLLLSFVNSADEVLLERLRVSRAPNTMEARVLDEATRVIVERESGTNR